MESDELRDLLADMAANEVEGRWDHYQKMEESADAPAGKTRAQTRQSTSTYTGHKADGKVNAYLDRLIYKPKLAYAQHYSQWLQRERNGPEPKRAGLSGKVAQSVRTKLDYLFGIKNEVTA